MKRDESLSPSLFSLSFAFCRHSSRLVLRIMTEARKPKRQSVGWRYRLLFVLFLHLPQLVTAGVLTSLGGIGIFFVFQPEKIL